jgi:hypothetical protein
MPIRILVAGAWRPAVADGNLRVRSGGTWIYPSVAKVRNNGIWVDLGYHGYPLPPTGLSVQAWDYSNCVVQWAAPTGTGAAINGYRVERHDVNNNLIDAAVVTGLSQSFAVNQDARYQFYVRSQSANGLNSAYIGPLKVAIGHPQTPNYGYVARQRGWQSAVIGGGYNRDSWAIVSVPDTVTITGLHWRNLRTPQSSVVTPTASRTVNWILNSGDFGAINANLGTVYSGNNTDWGLNNNGNNAGWGLIPRGTGWSTSGNSYYQMIIDQLWCDGQETYQNYEIVSYNPEQGNTYW